MFFVSAVCRITDISRADLNNYRRRGLRLDGGVGAAGAFEFTRQDVLRVMAARALRDLGVAFGAAVADINDLSNRFAAIDFVDGGRPTGGGPYLFKRIAHAPGNTKPTVGSCSIKSSFADLMKSLELGDGEVSDAPLAAWSAVDLGVLAATLRWNWRCWQGSDGNCA